MIGATALLLLFTVVLYAVVQVRVATGDLERETSRLRETRIEEAKRLGVQAVSVIAASSHFWIADNDFASLEGQVKPVVRGSEATDLPVSQGVITNDIGEVLAFASVDAGRERPKKLDVGPLKGLKEPTAELGEAGADGIPERVTVTAPIIDRNGKAWGYTQFIYELDGLRKTLEGIESQAAARSEAIIRRTGLIGLLVMVLGMVITILQALAISRPLVQLAGSADRIAEGDLSARAVVRGSDEIGQLATSFNSMADQVNNLLRETAAKTALERELEVARIIQDSLLPPGGVVRRGPMTVAGYFQSASICGGDFWTYMDFEGGRTFLGVGDVTGHGVPSAMITAACKSGLDTLKSVTKGRELGIGFLMRELNKTIHEAAQRKFFMTFFGLVVDPRDRSFEFANAGHNFPIMVRRQADGRLKSRALIARGNRLGDVLESEFTPLRERFEDGDMLCLYTDGIIEARNAKGQEYGERRFRRLLERVYELEPDAAIEAMVEDMEAFTGGVDVDDDITLVIAHFGR